MLQNEPGALFIQCSFFISSADLLSCARFLTHRGFPMTLHDSVRDRLRAIEALLRETEHWQETAPDSSAFASDKPFCLDTLEPLEWLQWVLIPRMHSCWRAVSRCRKILPLRPITRWLWIRPTRSRIHAGGTAAAGCAVCR
jgi:uncharacterized protein YqcC (DUF446 family)